MTTTTATQTTSATATVQAPRQPTLPSPVEQIKVQIDKGLAAGNDSISIQLHPQDMGRVDIKLDFQDGQVTTTVTADHPDTLQALKADAANLQQSLQDAGLNADPNAMSFQLRDGGQQQQQQGQASQGGNGQTLQAADTGSDEPLVSVAALNAQRAATAQAAGGVDISI
jgi:flagellar hook-length control protein FliK